MPLDSTHAEYEAERGRWRRIRDVLAGEDAVKAAGAAYLPRLAGQNASEYDAYKARAEFHEASGRTLDGLTGAIFRKEPMVQIAEAFEDLQADADGRGTPFPAFAKRAVHEVIGLGRYGVLVDVPSAGGDPFLAGYPAENIVNWRMTVVEGRPALGLVVLRETASVPAEDGFQSETIERYRVLSLEAETGGVSGAGPAYRVRLFERRRDKRGRGDFVRIADATPTRRGEKLTSIPFVFLGPTDLTADVQRPPLSGLVNVNLSHYRTSADLEHGAHFTALPTIYVAGDVRGSAEESGELRVGSGVAWQLEMGATAGMLEYRGQGLEALEKRLTRKEAHMAVLGARLLEDQKAGVESAEAIGLRHRGENSLLASIADTVVRGLGRALDWQAWWAGAEPDQTSVDLNKDFTERPLAPQEMVHLVAGWQQRGYGDEVLFHNLKGGERLPAGMTLEAWREDIARTKPTANLAAADPDEAAPDDASEGREPVQPRS